MYQAENGITNHSSLVSDCNEGLKCMFKWFSALTCYVYGSRYIVRSTLNVVNLTNLI